MSPTENGAKVARFAYPDILPARVSRHVFDAVLAQDVVNEAGTIHPAIRRIGRSIAVIEIAFRQLERVTKEFAHRLGIFVEAFDLVRRDRSPPSVPGWAMTWAIPLELVSEFRSGWATASGTISCVSAWVFLLPPGQASENSCACAREVDFEEALGGWRRCRAAFPGRRFMPPMARRRRRSGKEFLDLFA